MKTLIIDNSRERNISSLDYRNLKIIKTKDSHEIPKILKYVLKNKFKLIIAADATKAARKTFWQRMQFWKNWKENKPGNSEDNSSDDTTKPIKAKGLTG